MAGKHTNIGAKRAREARADLGLDSVAPIPCVLTLIEDTLDTPVVLAELPEDVAGACWRNDEQTLIWVNATQAAVRCRFTLAHELGHLRCGHDHDLPIDTFKTFSGSQADSREVQANAFAAEFLAPAEGVRRMVSEDPTLETVVRVAAHFGLSTIAALYRLNTLSLTRRDRRLKHEIDAGLQDEVWERLAPRDFGDEVARLSESDLPRLSPAIENSALAALIAGAVSTGEVAGLLGCDPGQVAAGAGFIGS